MNFVKVAMVTPDIQPILVPVDFTAESEAALLFANQLSIREERPLVVLHVTHDNGHNGTMYRRRAEKDSMLPWQEIAERKMKDFMNDVRDEHADLEVLKSAQTIVVDGLPATRILEVARSINAGHIVVGSSERGRLSRIFNGSVSVSLAKDSPIPLTVIHFKSQESESGKMQARPSTR